MRVDIKQNDQTAFLWNGVKGSYQGKEEGCAYLRTKERLEQIASPRHNSIQNLLAYKSKFCNKKDTLKYNSESETTIYLTLEF